MSGASSTTALRDRDESEEREESHTDSRGEFPAGRPQEGGRLRIPKSDHVVNIAPRRVCRKAESSALGAGLPAEASAKAGGSRNDPGRNRYGCFLPDLTGLATAPSARLPRRIWFEIARFAITAPIR